MKPSRKVLLGTILAGAVLLSSCSADEHTEPGTNPPAGSKSVGIHGMFVQRQLADYVRVADVIVVGHVLDKEQRIDKRQGKWKGAVWEYNTIRVDETIVGGDLDKLTVRRLVDSERMQMEGDRFTGDLKIGDRYLMVLIPINEGKYVISGEQGVAMLDGESVQFPPGEILVGNLTTTLSELRKLAEG